MKSSVAKKKTLVKKDRQKLANELRATLILMIHRGRSAHVGSNLSIADVISVLFEDILNVNPKNPTWADRDRFIMSKGHSAAVVWAAMAKKGFFPKEWLDTYYKDDGKLPGHVTKLTIPGVEVSTGSLGHGLPFATGVALAGKLDKKKYRVFTVMSDGEMDEGSNWEAILFAPHHNLDNLTVILDYNKIQSLDFVKNTLGLEPLRAKIESFGWAAMEIDGHNHEEILRALSTTPHVSGKPTFIIAHTIKGKGVSFMENKIEWHYNNTTEDMVRKAMEELGIKKYPI